MYVRTSLAQQQLLGGPVNAFPQSWEGILVQLGNQLLGIKLVVQCAVWYFALLYLLFYCSLFLPKQSASFCFQCTRQIISEKLGRGSRTVDLELEAQIDILRDNKKKYENILKLAQTLSTQLFQMVHTQKQLGDAFADLSLNSM